MRRKVAPSMMQSAPSADPPEASPRPTAPPCRQMGSSKASPLRTRCVEHPRGWDLRPAIRVRPAQRATENNTTGLVDRPMDANAKAKPRMPSIQKLTKASPVGVLKPCCTTNCERIYPWVRIPRVIGRSNGSANSLLSRSSADFIIIIAGYRFRYAQVINEAEAETVRYIFRRYAESLAQFRPCKST